MLKICQFVATVGEGGLERHFIDLVSGLSFTNQVVVVADPSFQDRLPASVEFIPLSMRGWRYNPVRLYRLAKVMRRIRPDVVHAHANKACSMVAALRNFLPGKHIATIHSIKKSVTAYAKFDGVIAVSSRVAQQIDNSRVAVIANGLMPPSATDGDRKIWESILGTQVSGPITLAVGRLVPVKGFDVLVKAWQGMADLLVIVGDGFERPKLVDLVQTLGLGDVVRFTGFRSDVPELLAAADVTVFSSWREGFPYVLVEALQAGNVIISTRVPGCEDLIPEQYLVDCGDSAGLHRVLARVLADLPAAQQDFAPIWDKALTELTVESMVERTLRFYHEVIDSTSVRIV